MCGTDRLMDAVTAEAKTKMNQTMVEPLFPFPLREGAGAYPPRGSQVVEILRPRGGPLVAQKVPKINHEEGHLPGRARNPQLNLVVPSLVKTDSVYPIQQVNTVRRTAKLDDNTGFREFFGRLDARNGPAPELTQGRENGLYVVRGTRKEKVDVTGETWIAVVDDGLAAHHDVLYLISLEQPDEFQDVRRKVGGLY